MKTSHFQIALIHKNVNKPWGSQNKEATLSSHPKPVMASQKSSGHGMAVSCNGSPPALCTVLHTSSLMNNGHLFPLALNHLFLCSSTLGWWSWFLLHWELQGRQVTPHCHFLTATAFYPDKYLAQAWAVLVPAYFAGVAPLPSNWLRPLFPLTFLSLPLPSTDSSLLT